jgi:hypothetical protein
LSFKKNYHKEIYVKYFYLLTFNQLKNLKNKKRGGRGRRKVGHLKGGVHWFGWFEKVD